MSSYHSIVEALKYNLQSDTNKIKDGVEILQNAYSNSQFVFVNNLIEIILNEKNEQVKILAAVQLKNIVKNDWNGDVLTIDTKNLFYKFILNQLENNSKIICDYLIEILQVICISDFPQKFSDPLTFAIAKINDFIHKNNWTSLTIYLKILSVSMLKYDTVEPNNIIMGEVKAILEACQVTLLDILMNLTNKLNLPDEQIVLSLLYLIRIISYIHTIDLPEYFENNIDNFNKALCIILQYSIKDEYTNEEDPTAADDLKYEVAKLLDKYISKYSEEVQVYVRTIFESVLICNKYTTNFARHDKLVNQLLLTMSNIVKINWDENYIKLIDKIQLILNDLVLSNIQLNDNDLESLKSASMIYIIQDIEGIHGTHRRHSVKLLLKALMDKYNVTFDYLSPIVETCLKDFNNSIGVDCGLFLLSCCVVKAQTRVYGATELRDQQLITRIIDEYLIHVLDANNQNLILITSILKFLALFRNYLNTQQISLIINQCTKYLFSNNETIYTYSAFVIEKLCMRNYITKQPLYDWKSIHNHNIAIVILNQLLVLAEKTVDNEFIIKCIWRICAATLFSIDECFSLLNKFLLIIKLIHNKSPNPRYIHIVFEAICLFLLRIGKGTIGDVDKLTDLHKTCYNLFDDALNSITMTELHPYFYQAYVTLLSTLPYSNPNKKEYNIFKEQYSKLIISLMRKDRWTQSASHSSFLATLVMYYFEREWMWSNQIENMVPMFLDAFNIMLKNKRIKTDILVNFISCIVAYAPLQYFEIHFKILFDLICEQTAYQYAIPISILTLRALPKHKMNFQNNLLSICKHIGAMLKKPTVHYIKELLCRASAMLLVVFEENSNIVLEAISDVSMTIELANEENELMDILELYDNQFEDSRTAVNQISLTRLDKIDQRYINNVCSADDSNKYLTMLYENRSLVQSITAYPQLLALFEKVFST